MLEYLLGNYCTSDDEAEVEAGIEQVKRILSDNYVRPDEAEQIKAKIKENGTHTVIDKISVKLNERSDQYEAEFLFLGIKGIYVNPRYVREYDKLLAGGIWCIVDLSYFYDEDDKRNSPFVINDITPIQMPNLDKSEIIDARKDFSVFDYFINSLCIHPFPCGYKTDPSIQKLRFLLLPDWLIVRQETLPDHRLLRIDLYCCNTSSRI